jgi:hypothetical protein
METLIYGIKGKSHLAKVDILDQCADLKIIFFAVNFLLKIQTNRKFCRVFKDKAQLLKKSSHW